MLQARRAPFKAGGVGRGAGSPLLQGGDPKIWGWGGWVGVWGGGKGTAHTWGPSIPGAGGGRGLSWRAGCDWPGAPRSPLGLAVAVVTGARRGRMRGPGSGAMAAVAAAVAAEGPAALLLLLLLLAAAGGDDSDWVRLPSKCEGERGRGQGCEGEALRK